MSADTLIYKVLTAGQHAALLAAGAFVGAPVDLKDGYVHLSTAAQLRETLARHFAGQADLRVLAVAVDALPAGALRWEPSRGGALFPHLYAPLPLAAVGTVWTVDVGADGRSTLPEGFEGG